MASASTSYGFRNECSRFDVFINCRDLDARKGLASHLYDSLRKRGGLRVFLDSEESQEGSDIKTQIEGAIKTASFHIPIFSPGYAESTRCLNELVQMLETGKKIIPVFYKVNPSELRRVRSGNGVYAQSLRYLAEKRTSDYRPRHDSLTLEKWRNALFVVAEISGFELKAYNGDEGLLVEEVVKQVLIKVAKPPLFVAIYPTGLDNKVENFEKTVLSQQKSEKTIVAGIVGIAGVGKTTLAKELFNRHRSNYDGSCFLSDVRQHAAEGSLNVLQRKLLEDLAQLDVDISSTYEGVETLKMHLPSSEGVLVVIDDVDHISQLEALVSPIQDTIHSSSLILVTSRDKDPLQTYGILDSFIYKQTGLNQQHSRELFCLHAFQQPYPPTGFEQMVVQYLDVCGGLPLSLRETGALLSGHDLDYWDAQLRTAASTSISNYSSASAASTSMSNYSSASAASTSMSNYSSASAASTSMSNYSSASAASTSMSNYSSASAASTSISNYVYDVFINCHGPDVKRTFANHLYHRLVSYGLRPFVDEERHDEEDNIGTQIREAIATASVHVAIFSLRYAESRRCLDELLLMLASGAPVIPVFYTVKRFDLQWTKDEDGVYAGVFGRTLQNHEKGTTYDSQASGEKPRDMSNRIEEWRKALHRISVPEISGFELEAFKDDEAELLDAVVKSVLKSVRKAPFYEVKYLKGLDQKMDDFENTVLLHRQSGKPQVVGIVGVAGVGKTTLAKELINRKSSSFNRTCFLFDVSGTVARSSLHFLQSKLFKDLTNVNIQIESVTQGIELFTKHFSSIHGPTAFVILDNVDDVHQLQALLPVQKLLPSKSLIVITSRFEDVLIHSGVEQSLIYSLTDLPLDEHPSGLDGKVKDLTNIILLQQQSEEPQVLGIVGIGGIGKTRLAMEFFNRKSSDYTRSYFLYDVNETARTSFTLHNLQSKLLQGLTQLDLQVQGVDEGIELFKEHVSYFRSLVILDNLDHWDQLHALLSVLTVLPSGSLILVTCREAEVLKRSGVQESSIYELNRLNNRDSLELFCTYAFGQPSPGHEFEDLAEKFVRACNGLPLTLKVFGALLWGKSNSYWQTLFHKFHRIHPDQIQKSLQLCYDELNEEEQKIFLHIACSCIGAKRDFAIRLWDASGSRGLSVFESLQKRCLVDVDREDCIIMHELLIELGRTNADEKGLRRRPRPRRENDSDLFRRSSIIREVPGFMIMIVILVMAMMIWNMWPRN